MCVIFHCMRQPPSRMNTCTTRRCMISRKLCALLWTLSNYQLSKNVLSCLWNLRLSPRLFGEPTNRDRGWRILWDQDRFRWNCQCSFQELVDILLLPRGTPLTVQPAVFLFQKDAESISLSPSASKYLNRYHHMCPEKSFYDLGSNPEHRCRTETADGALMTLTTNSHIWCLDGINNEIFMSASQLKKLRASHFNFHHLTVTL